MHKTSIVLSLLWCGCRSLVVPHCGSVLVFQSGFCLCVWHQKVNIFQLEEGVSLQGGVETLKEVSRFTVPADLTWPLWSSAQTCFYFKSNFHIKRFNLTMLSVFSLKFSYHPGPFLYFVFTFCFPPRLFPICTPSPSSLIRLSTGWHVSVFHSHHFNFLSLLSFTHINPSIL